MTVKNNPEPRPTREQLRALTIDELAGVIEFLIQYQPGCPVSGDGGCHSCRANEIRADKARELVRRALEK